MKRTGIILAALLILAGCAPRQEEGAGRAPVTVKVEKISDVSATSTVSYVGTAEAVRSAVVSAPKGGSRNRPSRFRDRSHTLPEPRWSIRDW